MITIKYGLTEIIIPRNASQESYFGKVVRGLGTVTPAPGVNLGSVPLSGTLFKGVLVVDRIEEKIATQIKEFLSKVTRFGSVEVYLQANSHDLGNGVSSAVARCILNIEGETKSYINRVSTFRKYYALNLPYSFWAGTPGGHGTRH
jgi:hypothetical protein